MLIDARELDDGDVLRSQVCIIGGGAAGITIARELAGTSIDVILLESGGMEADPSTQALYEGDLVGAPFYGAGNEIQLDECRLRYLGGTTNHWTGFCRPLEPFDFEPRPYVARSGWPLTRDDLDPYYERAVEVIRLASPRFDLAWWQDEHGLGEALLDTELVTTSMFQVHIPYSYAVAHRATLEDASNVRVVLWANATRLAMDDNSDRLRAVDVKTLSGLSLSIEAAEFVVAMGGIETPRLLLASNDVRTAGVGNGRDQVGRHFAEHLRAQVGHVVLRRAADELGLYNPTDIPAPTPENPDNTISAQGALTLTGQALAEHELLGLEVQFSYVREPEPSGPIHADGLAMDEVSPLFDAVGGEAPGSLAYVQVLGEQEPNPESRVRLGTERDALGMPKIELDWRHTELDRTSIVRGLHILGRELGRTGEGRLLSLPGGIRYMEDPEPEDFPFLEASAESVDPEGFDLGVGFHHLCATRMTDDPAVGVVDRDCRVHDVANLSIASSSVFATAATATPTFTITALALRLADRLKATLA